MPFIGDHPRRERRASAVSKELFDELREIYERWPVSYVDEWAFESDPIYRRLRSDLALD